MAIDRVGTIAYSQTNQVGKAVTAGNLLILCEGCNSNAATFSTPTSSPSATWTKVDEMHNTGSASPAVGMWWAVAPSTATITVTGDATGSESFALMEYSGADTTSPVQSTTKSSDGYWETSAVPQFGVVSPTQCPSLTGVSASSVVVAVFEEGENIENDPTTLGGYTRQTFDNDQCIVVMDKLSPSATEQPGVTWSTARVTAGMAASFKVGAGGGGETLSVNVSPTNNAYNNQPVKII